MGERFKLFGCVISLIMRNNKILMILRKNKPDAGNYNLVGGRMEEVCAALLFEVDVMMGAEVL